MGACSATNKDQAEEDIRRFEAWLPLNKISLAEYEDNIKKLVFLEDADEMTLTQMMESFKMCYAFDDISQQRSFFR